MNELLVQSDNSRSLSWRSGSGYTTLLPARYLPGFSPCINSPAHYVFLRVIHRSGDAWPARSQQQTSQSGSEGSSGNVNNNGVPCSVYSAESALVYNIEIIQQLPLKNTCQLYIIYTNIVARKLECFNARFRFCVPLMKLLAKPLA